MSNVNSVQAVALQINHVIYPECPHTVEVLCEGTQDLGVEWAVPEIDRGMVVGYQMKMSSTAPTADSVKTSHLFESATNTHYWIVLDASDSDSSTEWSRKCNDCCGSTPVMTVVTIPTPISENAPCATVAETSSYTHNFPIPANPFSLKFKVASMSYNGVADATAAAQEFADAAAILTWFQANEAARGTWSLTNSNKTLTLVSTTITSANVDIDLIAQSICYQYPASAVNVDAIDIGGVVTPLANTINFSKANPDVLIAAIQGFFPVGSFTKVVDGSDLYLNYTGTMNPVELYYNGSAIANGDFDSANCP